MTRIWIQSIRIHITAHRRAFFGEYKNEKVIGLNSEVISLHPPPPPKKTTPKQRFLYLYFWASHSLEGLWCTCRQGTEPGIVGTSAGDLLVHVPLQHHNIFLKAKFRKMGIDMATQLRHSSIYACWKKRNKNPHKLDW